MTSSDASPAAELPDLPRGIALAWGVAAAPQRGPKREMSVERIVETAVEIADAHGIGAVSMGAVAKALGFTSMSLYRYVSAKEDLLLLMQEEATGLPSEAYREKNGWREKIQELFRGQVEIYLRHSWILSLPIQGSPVTPNSSAWLEAALDALSETSLTHIERLAVSLAVSGQARWYGMVQAGYTDEARASGRSPEEISEQDDALYDIVIEAEEYPRLREAIDDGAFTASDDPFAFGLERLLDGVEAYIAGLERGEPHAESSEWIGLEDEGYEGDKRYRAAAKATRDAQKALLAAEKTLRQARRAQQQALREAKERQPRP